MKLVVRQFVPSEGSRTPSYYVTREDSVCGYEVIYTVDPRPIGKSQHYLVSEALSMLVNPHSRVIDLASSLPEAISKAYACARSWAESYAEKNHMFVELAADTQRVHRGDTPLASGEKHSPALHTRGEHITTK